MNAENVGGVSIRSRNGAPSRRGCVVNIAGDVAVGSMFGVFRDPCCLFCLINYPVPMHVTQAADATFRCGGRSPSCAAPSGLSPAACVPERSASTSGTVATKLPMGADILRASADVSPKPPRSVDRLACAWWGCSIASTGSWSTHPRRTMILPLSLKARRGVQTSKLR